MEKWNDSSYRLKTYLFYLLIFPIFFAGCISKERKEPNEILVTLENRLENSPFPISTTPFSILDSIPKDFKGIPSVDTVRLGNVILDNLSKIRSLQREQKLPKELLEKIKDKGLYCVTGYKKNKQFYIVDKNRDKDFSNDSIVIFDRALSKDQDKARSFFQMFSMPFEKLNQDTFIKDTAYIKIIPNSNYFGYLNKMTASQKIKKELQLVAQKFGYLYGEFEYLNKKYKIALSEYNPFKKNVIVFQDVDKDFIKGSSGFYIEHQEGDMVRLDSTYFLIDKINLNPKEIYLRKLELEGKVYGKYHGQYIRDYELTDLEGEKFVLSDLFDNNEYLLLDFWGTWCGPCKALTPDLKKIHKNYSNKLALLGLAYEEDVSKVKDYVDKNELRWFQAFLKGKPKRSKENIHKIISDLRVQSYPTFIILDKDLKIIYRGHGGTFKEMKEVLSGMM